MDDVRPWLSDEVLEKLSGSRGLVATVVTTGSVVPQFAENLSNMRDLNSRVGLRQVEYRNFYGVFVEAGRDEALQHALNEKYDWVMQVDADAAPFPQDACVRLLYDHYFMQPSAAMIGGYCQLKAEPPVPTIDTGTGTWEHHYPGEGLIEVMRTGGHFFIIKMDWVRRIRPPWFRSRMPSQPINIMMEFDNWCRINLDGTNPFAKWPEWETLFAEAQEREATRVAGGNVPGSLVGEDSGWCDKLKAHGGRIFVDTDVVVGHMTQKTILPGDLKKALQDQDKRIGLSVGVLNG